MSEQNLNDSLSVNEKRKLERQERVRIAVANGARIESYQSTPAAFEEQNEDVCILFADLVGSTDYKYSRTAVEGLQKSHKHNYFVQESVESEDADGEITTFLGDGVMAFFPEPKDGPPTAARRAIDAAMNIIRRLRDYNQSIEEWDWPKRISTRIGIHYGKAWMMQFQQSNRLNPQGATVDLAARLCKIAPQMHALLTDETFRAAGFDPDIPADPQRSTKWRGPERRRLKGVKGFKQIFAITADGGLVSEIPLAGAVTPPTPEAVRMLERARVAARDGRIEDGEYIYRDILKADPRNFEANFELAELRTSYTEHVPERDKARLDEAYDCLCEAKAGAAAELLRLEATKLGTI